MIDVQTLPTIGAMLLFWVLGLYVLTRGLALPSAWLAALGQALFALYLLGYVVSTTTPDAHWFWGRGLWLGAVATPVVWHWLAIILAGREAIPTGVARGLGLTLSVVLAALGIAGVAGDAVFAWGPAQEYLTPLGLPASGLRPAALYPVFVAVTLANLALGVVWLASAGAAAPADSLRRAQLQWVLASGAIFTLGATYMLIVTWLLALPPEPGHAVLAVGVALVGVAVARYNALIAGQVIWTDLLYFGLANLVLAIGYGAVVAAFAGLSRDALPLVLTVSLVATATHALANPVRGLWDRLFYRGDVRLLRAELRALEEATGRAQEQADVVAEAHRALERLDDARLRATVEDALRKLNDTAALVDHPLTTQVPRLVERHLALSGDAADPARSVAEATSLHRVRALRSALVEAIERLRPPDERPEPVSAAWAQYLILHDAYVEGRQNKDVMRRHQLSEGTFNRARRRAIDLIAADLRERDAAPAAADHHARRAD